VLKNPAFGNTQNVSGKATATILKIRTIHYGKKL